MYGSRSHTAGRLPSCRKSVYLLQDGVLSFAVGIESHDNKVSFLTGGMVCRSRCVVFMVTPGDFIPVRRWGQRKRDRGTPREAHDQRELLGGRERRPSGASRTNRGRAMAAHALEGQT